MEICRKITLVLSALAILVCCFFLNTLGAGELIKNGYANCGYALYISTALLTVSYIFGLFKKVFPTLALNIVGSAGYIYTLAVLNAIPHTLIPKQNVEKVMVNHMFTIIVTVLLVMLAVFNFFETNNAKKRADKKAAKKYNAERPLEDKEHIV